MASDVSTKNTKSTCTNCLDDIVGLRIKCVECTDFDLCLQCFSNGAEIGQHLSHHSYRVVDYEALDVFRINKSKWTTQEELLLLNGVEKYGIGNWENVSQHIKTRSADEARDEYMSRYVEGVIGRATWSETYEKRPKLADLIKDDSLTSTGINQTIPPLDINLAEANELGYTPQRDDFEYEYDNDAETLVSCLNVTCAYDNELDTALKLAHVDMYIDKLRERDRRKKICREYQLVSKFFASRRERPRHRHYNGEHDTEENLRYLCRFQTAQQHDFLTKNVQKQRNLERRLSELIRYRKYGLTKMEELPHFEQELAINAKLSGSSTHNFLNQALKRKREESDVDEMSSTIRNCNSSMDPPEHHAQWPRRLQLLQRVGINHPRLSEPAAHLLSDTESKLCSTLEITASQFISMKTLILANPHREAKNGTEEQIRNYIRSNGWLTLQA